MQVERAYKTELDPTNKQITLLGRHVGTARFVYNWALAERIDSYELVKSMKWIDEHEPTIVDNQKIENKILKHQIIKSLTQFEQSHHLTLLKKQEKYHWLKNVDSWAGVSALDDLNEAYKNFFRRVKKGKEKSGFPRFRQRGRDTSYHAHYQGCRIENNFIRLIKLGNIRLKEHNYLPPNAKVNSVTISEKAGRWFVSIQVSEKIMMPEKSTKNITGIDVGIHSLATLPDGTVYDNPKTLKRFEQKLKKLQRSISLPGQKSTKEPKPNERKRKYFKKKGSKNWVEAQNKVARLHIKIARIRKDYINKITTELATKFSIICIEGLKIKNMVKNHHLAQAISDASWGEFYRQLAYKCKWHGTRLIEVDTYFPSTKMCSQCGHVKDEMKLSERTYKCDKCGLEMDRDQNASHNLMTVAASLSETLNACGETSADLEAVVFGRRIKVKLVP